MQDSQTCSEDQTTVGDVLKADPETAQDIVDWQQATYLLLGTIIRQQGRRAVKITRKELREFQENWTITFKVGPKGALHYSLKPIKH